MELISTFALPLPTLVILKLVGIADNADIKFANQIRQLTRAIARSLEVSGMSSEEISEANVAIVNLEGIVREKLEERRSAPKKDILSLLLNAEENGHRLSDEEIIANVIFLFIAGHESTSNMIGNALITLHRHPAVLAQVKQNAELLPKCVAECLRYDTSVQMSFRDVLENIEIDGYKFRRGDTILICSGAANHDPEKFMIDRSLDIRHVISFGGGIHYCIGVRLAAIEIEAALAALLEQLPKLRIDNLDNLQWNTSNTLRGVQSLQASWA